MKATPSKTPAKGGGLFAFGFTKKASPPPTTTSNSTSNVPSSSPPPLNLTKPASAEKPLIVEKLRKDVAETVTILSDDEPIPILDEDSKQDVVSMSFNAKRTTAEAVTSTVAKNDKDIGKKRRIVLDEESDDEPSKPTTTGERMMPSVAGKRKVETVTPPPSSKKKALKKNDSDEEAEVFSEEDEDSASEVDEDDVEDVVQKKKRAGPAGKGKPITGKSSGSPPPASGSPGLKQGVLPAGEHEHDLLPWFQERKDSSLRLPQHPDYDTMTLFVPPGYIEGKPSFHIPGKARKITDAMRVWWDFFSKNADCVVAFKVGKFYELYHQCSDVAVRLCDLLYMKGETAHCGFPEIAWAKNMSKLVNANYRVARVEQTETPDEMEQRTGKKSGMVRREVCQVLSPGTMTLSVRDCGEGFVPRGDGRVQLLAVAETPDRVGICLLDASTGKFRLGEFDNDEHRVGLRACLAFETPAEIVYVRSKTTSQTIAVLLSETKALHTCLTAKHVGSVNDDWSRYFADSQNNEVPEILRNLADSPLANQALITCVRVLQRALVDDELMTMGRFSKYTSPTAQVAAADGSSDPSILANEAPLLKMDAQALRHLEIVANATDGSKEGTLLEYLDRSRSAFGGRLFREWVTRPLASISHILQRQEAVKQILCAINDPVLSEFRKVLQTCPDLERNLSKIHAIGLAKKANHPDTRAVIYGAEEVNKSKIETLCATLNALKSVRVVGEKLGTVLNAVSDQHSYLVRILENLASPVALKMLNHFDQAFDAKQAKKSGTIEPREGVAPSYDAGLQGVSNAKAELTNYLAHQKKQLNTQLTYFSPAQGKQKFQIEVAESRQVPDSWTMSSKRKGFKRYMTPQLKDLILQLDRAESALADASVDVTRTVFAEFDKHKTEWLALVRAAAEMDCLIALALVSCESTESCTPEFIREGPPCLELSQARHPCVAAGLDRLGKNSFIPNDTFLNSKNGRCLLLTGPNMGGKSTLLRQTCLAVIVAQMGCCVQAQGYRGTVVDAIFTRVGASDRILEGQSTFFVELSETATILRSATANSLVILDELGRGTSTFDGTAIAHSVISKLLDIGCRTMFATHYHSLVREVGRSRGVALGHMACVADREANQSDKEDVTFLYKLQPGASDRSYGLNVARLARLPEEIVKRAHVMSQKFERAFERHLREKLLEEVSLYCAQPDPKRLRLVVQRAECFAT